MEQDLYRIIVLGQDLGFTIRRFRRSRPDPQESWQPLDALIARLSMPAEIRLQALSRWLVGDEPVHDPASIEIFVDDHFAEGAALYAALADGPFACWRYLLAGPVFPQGAAGEISPAWENDVLPSAAMDEGDANE